MINFKHFLEEKYEDELSDKERNNLSSLHNELTDHYRPASYLKKQVNSLKQYTGASSINSALWDNHKNNEPMSERETELSSNLDSALKQNKTPKSFTVYSASRHDPRKMKDENDIVQHPAYISSTINPAFARRYPNIGEPESRRGYKKNILKIKVPKDHEGAYVGDHISTTGGEHEFILPRGLKLRHKKTEVKRGFEIDSSTGKENKDVPEEYHIHHMEIVP